MNDEVKTKRTPVPNGTDAMMGAIQGRFGYVVNARQKRPVLEVDKVCERSSINVIRNKIMSLRMALTQ